MRWLITVVCCIGAAAGLGATVVVPADFAEVVAGSSIIAYGRVIDVEAVYAGGRQRIDSVVTVEVFEWYRGAGTETLRFTTPGGTIGRYRQMMAGAPAFKRRDEAFLFLKQQDHGGLPVIFGLHQGVFRVRPDARGQRQVVRPMLLLPEGSEAQPVRRGDRDRRPLPVGDFVAALRTVIASPRAAAR